MGPGDPAAHRTDCLPLLPSGPGGVHRVPLHRAQPLILKRGSPVQSTLKISVRSHEYDTERRYGRYMPRCSMAERVGFEPTVPLPERMLSKHVDSSTLAPLRVEKHKGWHLSMRMHDQQGERVMPLLSWSRDHYGGHLFNMCILTNGGMRFPRSYGLTLAWVQRYKAIRHCYFLLSYYLEGSSAGVLHRCESGGTGRRARLRISWVTVGVQVPPLAPSLRSP